jgi:hypothetical protein
VHVNYERRERLTKHEIVWSCKHRTLLGAEDNVVGYGGGHINTYIMVLFLYK